MMNYAPQIIESLKSGPINKIMLVDDAYDAPSFDPDDAGSLLTLLERDDVRDHLPEETIDDDALASAIVSLQTNELDADAITIAHAAVYQAWMRHPDEFLDPGDKFKDSKGATLEALGPLTKLLNESVEPGNVMTTGNNTAASDFSSFKPDMLFMDYYLSSAEPTTGKAKALERTEEQRSIALAKELIRTAENRPSIILMSSKDVGSKAERYRTALEDQVLKLRFGFVKKAHINIPDAAKPEEVQVEDETADTLLDAIQGFQFGREVELALKLWRDGAKKGLEILQDDIAELDVRDFAYLLRFRLHGEGESFADYLEGFLGDSLRATVDDTVQWDAEPFANIDDPAIYTAIEGGHPDPSKKIAQLYHRIRFSMPNRRSRSRFKLGDVFLDEKKTKVRVVISPDCDLIPRSGGRPRSVRLLTMGGTIHGSQNDKAFASELIIVKRINVHAIRWDLKDIATHMFEDNGTLELDKDKYTQFGTLRPLEAQNIQKLALADLSRVGVAVAPTVYELAVVRAYIKPARGKYKELIPETLSSMPATVLMARGGDDDRARLFFDRKYVRALLAALEEVGRDGFTNKHHGDFVGFMTDVDRVQTILQQEGLVVEGDGHFNAAAFKSRRSKDPPWLQFVADDPLSET